MDLRRKKTAAPKGFPRGTAPHPPRSPPRAPPRGDFRPNPPLTVAGDQAQQERRFKRARQQALSDWHRVDLGSLEAPWKDQSQPTSELMPRVLTRLNLDQRLAESQILQLWDRVLDRTITAHAKPVGLRRGTLFINVDSNTWLSELVRYRYDDMLEKIQLSVGKDKVERLSLRVG